MKITVHKLIALAFLLALFGCSTEEPKQKGDEFRRRHSQDFRKINPNYFPYFLGTTIGIVVIGTLFLVTRNNKKEKQKRENLLSQITKSRKAGEIMDADYEEIKKDLDPMNYKPLLRSFEFALANKRRFDFLHSKYPKQIAMDLFEQKTWVGMSVEQLIDSKGHPKRTEEEILTNKTIRTYIYERPGGIETYNIVDGMLESADKT